MNRCLCTRARGLHPRTPHQGPSPSDARRHIACAQLDARRGIAIMDACTRPTHRTVPAAARCFIRLVIVAGWRSIIRTTHARAPGRADRPLARLVSSTCVSSWTLRTHQTRTDRTLVLMAFMDAHARLLPSWIGSRMNARRERYPRRASDSARTGHTHLHTPVPSRTPLGIHHSDRRRP
jgi:hypothetical protein